MRVERVERAVVLLSGGIDSATVLYYAKSKGYKSYCLSFDYGQRHIRELISAKRLARISHSAWKMVKVSLPWKGSSLLDKKMDLPKGALKRRDIPNTYVPSRNIIFLSLAASYAETIGAGSIFIGANQIDYSGYPDCRGAFLKAFQYALNEGTRQGESAKGIRVEAPLLNRSKVDIVRTAMRLKVPLGHTWSCYSGRESPCLRCDSCLIRADAFKKAGIKDPLIYGRN